MDLKSIGIGALLNAGLTVILSLIFFPLLFLGPITGGFLASYLSSRYEDYKVMDEKDGMVLGAISGLIGGFIASILFILGIGDISPVIGFISDSVGPVGDNFLVSAYLILQFSLIMSFILGLVGGVLGVVVKK